VAPADSQSVTLFVHLLHKLLQKKTPLYAPEHGTIITKKENACQKKI